MRRATVYGYHSVWRRPQGKPPAGLAKLHRRELASFLPCRRTHGTGFPITELRGSWLAFEIAAKDGHLHAGLSDSLPYRWPRANGFHHFHAPASGKFKNEIISEHSPIQAAAYYTQEPHML
jgi:hypothetical protein